MSYSTSLTYKWRLTAMCQRPRHYSWIRCVSTPSLSLVSVFCSSPGLTIKQDRVSTVSVSPADSDFANRVSQ